MTRVELETMLQKSYFLDIVMVWCSVSEDDMQDDLVLGDAGDGVHVRNHLIDLILTHEKDVVEKAMKDMEVI